MAVDELCAATGIERDRLRLLRKERCRLLCEIHKLQQSLDCLDSMIWQARGEKPRGTREKIRKKTEGGVKNADGRSC